LNFEYTKTTTAGKTEATLQEWKLKLNAGIVHYVEIQFPAGCAGLVHVRLLHGIHPVIPMNADDDINGDNTTVPFKLFYPLGAADNVLRLQAWNEDEVHNHTISVRVSILREEDLNPWLVLERLVKILETLIGL